MIKVGFIFNDWLWQILKKLRITARTGYEPHFHGHICTRKLGHLAWYFCAFVTCFVPFRLRDKMAEKLARALTKKSVNHVFVPRLIWNSVSRIGRLSSVTKWIEEMFVTVAQVMLGIGEIAIRSKNIYKNAVNSLVLSISNKPKTKGITSFWWCHMVRRLMPLVLFCIHTACRWHQCITLTEIH